MITDDLLKQGIAALNEGRKAEARRLLMQVVQQDERNETAWLWLSGVVDTDEERRTCLEKVLAINPNNGIAQRGIEALQKRSPGLAPTPDAASREDEATLQSVRETETSVKLQPSRKETTTGGVERILQQTVAAIKSGEKEKGKQLLIEIIEQDESNETAWLWMTRCVADRDAKRECFERVLAINPDNQHAIKGLKRLEVLSKVERSTKRRKPTKRRTGLIVGLGAVGLMLAVAFVGIWWAFDSGLLPLVPAVPAAASTTQVPSAAGATSTPMPNPTRIPTWTPAPTHTPAPTRTPRPTNTPRPTATPWPVDEELIVYLEKFAPIANQVWSMFPGDGGLDKSEYYAKAVGALCDQLEAMTVPESAKLMHIAFKNVAINIVLFHQSWWGVTMFPDQAYQFAADTEVYASEALAYYYDHYLPAREELLRGNRLSAEEFGFTD